MVVHVTLDLSNGNTLGLKLMKNPATGRGACVKSLDAGGQAEGTGKLSDGQVITHVNGEDIREKAMKDIGAIIKSRSDVKFTLEGGAETSDNLGDGVNSLTVTLDRANGKSLGIKLMKNPATGKGAAIKSVDVGGQADQLGTLKDGMVILKINGNNVTECSGMKEIGAMIKANDKATFVLENDASIVQQLDTNGDGQVSQAELDAYAKKPGVAAIEVESKTVTSTATTTTTVELATGTQALGLKLMKNPDTGQGVAVKSMDPGGQAEQTGVIQVGAIILKINGQDVTKMKMRDVGPIIKSSNKVSFVMETKVQTTSTVHEVDITAAAPKETSPAKNSSTWGSINRGGSKTSKTATTVATTSSSSGKTEVMLDTSNGASLGLKLMKNPATGLGCAVKALDPGGMAEKTGIFAVGDVILKINGNDVTQLRMKEIGPIIKASQQVNFLLDKGSSSSSSSSSAATANADADADAKKRQEEEKKETERKERDEKERKEKERKEKERKEKERKEKEEQERTNQTSADNARKERERKEKEEKERKAKDAKEARERKEKQEREDRERKERQEREDRERKEKQERENSALKSGGGGGGSGVSSQELQKLTQRVSSVESTSSTQTRTISTIERTTKDLEPRVEKLEQQVVKINMGGSSAGGSSSSSGSDVSALQRKCDSQAKTISTLETQIKSYNAEFLSFKNKITGDLGKCVKSNEFTSFRTEINKKVTNVTNITNTSQTAPQFDPHSITSAIKEQVNNTTIELRREISSIKLRENMPPSKPQADPEALRERQALSRRCATLEREVEELKAQLASGSSGGASGGGFQPPPSYQTTSPSRQSKLVDDSNLLGFGNNFTPTRSPQQRSSFNKRPTPTAASVSSSTHSVSYDAFASQSLKSKLVELFTAADQTDGTTSFDTAAPDMYLDQTELKFRLRTHELALLLKDTDLMKKIDRNNDGELSATELLKALDVNNDGKISLEEFFAGLIDVQTQHARPRDRKETVSELRMRMAGDDTSPSRSLRRLSANWNTSAAWDDPRNSAAVVGAQRPRTSTVPQQVTGFNTDSYTIQTLLKKCFIAAESSKGEKSGQYIAPERIFNQQQMQYLIDEKETTHALGRTKTFDPSKGAPQSIAQIFAKLPLDSDGRLSILTFLTMCDPLTMVKNSLGEQLSGFGGYARPASSTGTQQLTGASSLGRGTKNKLENMFVEMPGTGDTAWKADRHTALTPKEGLIRMETHEFLTVMKEVCEFEMFETTLNGKMSIANIFTKLDKLNRGSINLGDFSNFIASKDTAAKSSRIKERKANKSRFGTFGRRKKRAEVDTELGIKPDGHERGTPIQAIFSKQPLLY